MREYAADLERLGTFAQPTAAISPMQNSVTERHGGAWKRHARAIVDEPSLDFQHHDQVRWLCTCVNYAVMTTAGPCH